MSFIFELDIAIMKVNKHAKKMRMLHQGIQDLLH